MKEQTFNYEQFNKIKAVALAAGADKMRPYLNGVYIDSKENCTVATNGHVMLMHHDEAYSELDSCIIPLALLNSIKITKKDFVTISTHEASVRERVVSIQVIGGASQSMPAIDGTFPDYKRVIPDNETQLKQQSTYGMLGLPVLNILAKASKLAGGRGVVFDNLCYQGQTTGRLSDDIDKHPIDFVAMPMRAIAFNTPIGNEAVA